MKLCYLRYYFLHDFTYSYIVRKNNMNSQALEILS